MFLPLPGKLQCLGPGNECSSRCVGAAANQHRRSAQGHTLIFGPARGLAREDIYQVGIFPPKEVTEALTLRGKGRLSRLVSVSENGRETCVLAGTRAGGYPDGVYSFCPPLSTEFLKKFCGGFLRMLPLSAAESWKAFASKAGLRMRVQPERRSKASAAARTATPALRRKCSPSCAGALG